MIEQWSPACLPDLSGTVALVTGANSGLGLYTALGLARRGAYVVMACRDAERGRAAVAWVRERHREAAVELRSLDLADLDAVRAFAEPFRRAGSPDRVDLLVNNAGVMAIPRRSSPDGFELQLATNHLGHFALTGLLLPALLRGSVLGGPPRVVTVSSFVHRIGRIHTHDLMLERAYSPYRAYAQSKLANLHFMRELQRRADAAGLRLASLGAHPGWASTGLYVVGPQMSGSVLLGRFLSLAHRCAQSAEQGAWPTLRAAADPQARGGEFFGPAGFCELRGVPRRVGTSRRAADPGDAAWLWERSTALTGVRYEELA